MLDSSQISRGGHRILVGSWSVALHSGAPLVLALGVIGQLVDSRASPGHVASTEIHALFGVLLCAAVMSECFKAMKDAPLATPCDIAMFTRNQSRKLYLLMYVLLGLRMAMGLGRPPAEAAEGFRDYLIGGILALVLVRVLAARRLRIAQFMPLDSRQRAESL